jgi:hypothetical protein
VFRAPFSYILSAMSYQLAPAPQHSSIPLSRTHQPGAFGS